ncbi:MAG: hypothetical protein KBA33_09000 [Cloacibacterium sp.]|nr:hypothetical protein [Cloacibacterium sp.]
MGWFHGFKLSIVINDKGNTLSFCVTRAKLKLLRVLDNKKIQRYAYCNVNWKSYSESHW